MRVWRTIAAVLLVLALGACGGAGSNDDPAPVTTVSQGADRPGESIGVADAIDRTRAVADRAEERLDAISHTTP
jgi:hypothetical protein